jgi:hypothetical protein
MNYHISRDGQQFGPYTLAEVQRYVADGNILLTDLACSEGMDRWVTVREILGNIPVQPAAPSPPNYGQVPVYQQPQSGGAQPAYAGQSGGPLPPDLHWGLVLLFGVLCGIFMWVWIFVQANFVKKLRPDTKCMLFYGLGVAGIVLGYIVIIAGAAAKEDAITAFAGLIFLVACVFIIMGHFSLKNSLEDYYNTVEPLQLQLSGVMTFFFNVIYFQYHFNWIRQYKLTGVRTR